MKDLIVLLLYAQKSAHLPMFSKLRTEYFYITLHNTLYNIPTLRTDKEQSDTLIHDTQMTYTLITPNV